MQARGLLAQTFSWQDMLREEHARAFTVAKLARLDLLDAIYREVLKGVEQGQTLRDFSRALRPLLEREGWWGKREVIDPKSGEVGTTVFDPARLKLIYDTNLRTAHAAGQWERIERNAVTHPYLRYVTRRDERVRASHAAWHNLTLPVGHPFWHTHYPPNGWRCRCRVVGMTQAEYDKGLAPNGQPLKTDAPDIVMVKWKDRQGNPVWVAEGIDPGWDYNPGIASMRAQNLQRITAEKLAAASAPIREAAIKAGLGDSVTPAVATPQAIADFLSGHGEEPLRIAALPEDIRAQLGALSDAVMMSRYTADKQRKHPEITAESYSWLQELLDNGERLYDKEHHVTTILHRGQLYMAVVKVTKDKGGVFLQSFRRTDEKNVASLKKRVEGAGGG